MRFKDKSLKRFWNTGRAKGINPEHSDRLKELLSALNAATKPGDMDLPGYAYHHLKGNRAGEFAVEISGPFRLVFEWHDGEAILVRPENYHGN